MHGLVEVHGVVNNDNSIGAHEYIVLADSMTQPPFGNFACKISFFCELLEQHHDLEIDFIFRYGKLQQSSRVDAPGERPLSDWCK